MLARREAAFFGPMPLILISSGKVMDERSLMVGKSEVSSEIDGLLGSSIKPLILQI